MGGTTSKRPWRRWPGASDSAVGGFLLFVFFSASVGSRKKGKSQLLFFFWGGGSKREAAIFGEGVLFGGVVGNLSCSFSAKERTSKTEPSLVGS